MRDVEHHALTDWLADTEVPDSPEAELAVDWAREVAGVRWARLTATRPRTEAARTA